MTKGLTPDIHGAYCTHYHLLVGDKSSKREECAKAQNAVKEASKRYWPAMAGFYPPYFAYGGYGPPFVPFGYGRYFG